MSVNDTTPVSQGGVDLVLSAAEAATLSRPGRPAALTMPIGVDPIAELEEIHCNRLFNLQARIAQVRKQTHADPYDRQLNAPLVIALLEGVTNGRQPLAFDNDFNADEIQGLFDSACIMYHEHGSTRSQVFDDMLVLCGSMREMKKLPTLDSVLEEDEDNGEVMLDGIEPF